MSVRKSIATLPADELARLKRAWLLAQEDVTNLYDTVVGSHGWPLGPNCPHHSPDLQFLPWHRQYLLDLENILRQYEPEVTLPFWDWAGNTPPNTLGGLPTACRPEPVGTLDLNALSSAPMRWVRGFVAENLRFLDADWLELLGNGTSRRAPRAATNLHDPGGANLQQRELEALAATDFTLFTERSEAAHDQVHGHVGAHMSQVVTAAFDPIFWLHHVNVDRQWAIWQKLNPQLEQHPFPDAELAAYPGRAIATMLDITTLDYTYEGLDLIAAPRAAGLAELAARNGLDPNSPRFSGPRLLLENLVMPIGPSVLVRIFNLARRPIGEQFILGMGPQVGHMHGHRRMVPFRRSIPLSDLSIKNIAQVRIVATTTDGQPVPLESLTATPPRIEILAPVP